jgi:ribosome-associated toxin RatA of RatAB toxin-antitoxin module
MHVLKRNVLVPYSARQMFELVNDIEEYPRFLPWCHQSSILSKTETEVTASLDIAWKGIHKSFTTRNTLTPYNSIVITLITGPLKHMEGTWHFHAIEQHGCKVLLNLEFEFTGNFTDILFQPIFQHIANTLVEAFVKRAAELYGLE